MISEGEIGWTAINMEQLALFPKSLSYKMKHKQRGYRPAKC